MYSLQVWNIFDILGLTQAKGEYDMMNMRSTAVNEDPVLAQLRAMGVPPPPIKQLPIVLCLDTSGSMGNVRDEGDKAPIDLVCEGLKQLHAELCADSRAKDATDLCVLTFGGNLSKPFTVLKEFGPIRAWAPPNTLVARGETYLGKAILNGLRMLEKRQNWYRNQGILSYEPWIIVMTDGRPSKEDAEATRMARKELVERQLGQSKSKLTLMTFFACEEDLLETEPAKHGIQLLESLYPKGLTTSPVTVLGMTSIAFSSFFKWVSVSIMSQSLEPRSWNELHQ